MPGDNPSGGATSGSGSGSGSSSGGSGGTVRPTAAQTSASHSAEATTFTFSSKRSPFIHNSPPGAITFISPPRKGDGSHRDRQHRRQPGAASTPTTRSEFSSDWIPLRPLRPVTEVSLPIFSSPKPDQSTLESGPTMMNTHVFAARGVPESHKPSNAKPSPRLSLVAQHYHATTPHPFFDTPPHLITPPPVDPFRQLAPYDGYFPPMPPKPSKSKSKSSRHKSVSQLQLAEPSSSTPDISDSKQRTPRPSSSRAPSRAHTVKPSSSSRPAPRTPSIFLTGPKPGPQPPPASSSKHGKSPALVHPSQSQMTTPRQYKSRTPKSQTPPESSGQTHQPSIAVFRDCFGVLTATENVFPTRAGSSSHRRSGSRGSENQGSGSGSIVGVGSEFQRRWTRRWLRRTMRGVGSMGSGSTSGSGSAGSTGGKRSTKTGSGSTMMRLTLTAGEQMMTKSSGSQDSLDRVRVSRSNAGSPSASMGGGQTPHGMLVDLSDVDEGEAENEADDPTPPAKVPGPGPAGKQSEMETIDGGTHVQEMMEKLGTNDQPELAPAPVALA